MGKISILDSKTANQIKAGEVIERPVSVIKELFDNSADAGASSVKIEFAGGGISLIRVTDNGCGMDREDALNCFLLHATSKLHSVEELYDLSTQGFRGEALASIAACSDVKLLTKLTGSDMGTMVSYEDGALVYSGDGACDYGTVVEVRNLFKNIPARYKFLKKDSTEGMYICQLVEKLAIINPHIAVKLIKDGKVILTTPGNGDVLDTLYAIYGKQLTESLKYTEYTYENHKIRGYVGVPSFVRGNRALQCLFVNDRPVRNQTVSAAIDEAYKNAVMKGKHPVCFLMVYCPSGTVDVNVHPQKAEVRFNSESDIFRLVYHSIRNVLFESQEAPEGFKAKPTVVYDKQPVTRPESRPESHKLTVNNDNPSRNEVDNANKLLALLSEYKPDVSVIAEEPAPVPETVDVPKPSNEQIAMDIKREPVIADAEIEELYNGDYIGTLFATYIIIQSDSNVFFVDQHAAHERILYERFMNKKIKAGNNDITEEDLLVPQIVKVSSADYTFISDNVDRFKECGFEIDVMDDREIVLRRVPMSKRRSSPSKMFEEILTDLKHETPDKSDIWYNLIQTTACKAAVKAGDKLDELEIRELLGSLRELDDPYHCAHGRPTFFKVSRTDLEKRFKRIV